MAQEEREKVIEIIGRDDFAKARGHQRKLGNFDRLDVGFGNRVFLAGEINEHEILPDFAAIHFARITIPTETPESLLWERNLLRANGIGQ